MNATAINALIENSRYNPEILGELTAYLQHQVDHQAYHFEANLAILKLYQFHPSKVDKTVVAKILIKALMNLPHTHFLLCSYLVNERLQTEESLSKLFTLANLLETAHFKGFWTEAANATDLLAQVPGFNDAIRNFVAGLIGITYQTISVPHLAEAFNLEAGGKELTDLIASKGWKLNGDFVTIPPNEELHNKSKKAGESFNLDQMAKLLTSVNH